MLRRLDYQDRVLETLDVYLDILNEEKGKADKVAQLIVEQPDLGIPHRDFAAEAWVRMKSAGRLPASRGNIPYSARYDGVDRPVPDLVLKVPTGGGKTFLAVDGLSRIFGRYLNRNTGFVLWIVPNEAIYSQTLRHLSDRQHPYRQVLDRAAAGRVRILEKADPLNARDIEDQLCVMLLMLQSANRDTQDSLKMFQDRGDVHGFFPAEGDQLAHRAVMDAIPNLSAYDDIFPMIKDSLGNALRVIRPVVVLDEGHRAVSDLAFRTLYGFNPCFVLELDECHVITHHAGTAEVVGAIKDGLEQDGLGDLVLAVVQGDTGAAKVTRKIPRRDTFASTEIYLPKVLLVEDEARELDYETDLLSKVDWRGFDPQSIADRIPENAQAAENQLQRISITDTAEHFAAEQVTAVAETIRFDPAHAVRMISDIVPNPFVGREIVGRLFSALEIRGFDRAKIGSLASLIVEELRKGLDTERTARAEARFKEDVAAGRIQFRLRLDGKNWRMPFTIETTEADTARQLVGKGGCALERSLFAPVYESELNGEETDVAVYLDGEKALVWWHRNVARAQYGLQGWRRSKIYPDFIFAVQGYGKSQRVTVLETKGDQLDNLDTGYKREVLKFLSSNFAWDSTVPAGTLELIKANGETVECTLILMSEWQAKLPGYLTPKPAAVLS